MSIFPSEFNIMISSWAAQIVPTILSLIVILIPISLTLWAIGFGVKKGISFLQRKAMGSMGDDWETNPNSNYNKAMDHRDDWLNDY